jgi:hypothetical protein
MRNQRSKERARRWRSGVLAVLLLPLLYAGQARAESGEWEFTLTPYLWLAF